MRKPSRGMLLASAGAVMALTGCGASVVPTSTEPLGTRSGAVAAPTAVESAVLTLPQRPDSSGAAREVFQIDSVRSLVENSDLVIVGKAIGVRPGRNAGAEVGGKLGFRDVTVSVEHVIHGTYDGSTLTLEELGWKDGEPFTINHAAWAAEGDEMLMGLMVTTNGSTEAGPRYILTSTAARFFLRVDGSVDDNYLEDFEQREAPQFVADAKVLSATELIRTVKAAG